MKYSDLQDREASHLMIFGDPGTGKSTLVAKLAEEGFHLWWFSIDNGHTIIKKLPAEAKQNIDIFILPDTSDFPIGYATILKAVKGEAINICDAHGQVECSACKIRGVGFSRFCGNELGSKDIMVVDPLSRIAQSALQIIAEKKGFKSVDPVDVYKMTEPDWGTHWGMMDKVLKYIEQASWNIICTAHVLEGVAEDNSKKLVPLVGTRNFSVKCGGYFDHVVYCSVLNSNHKFGSSTTYMNSILTKSRSDVALEKLTTPSLKPFFDGTIGSPVKQEVGVQAASATLAGVDPAVAAALASLRK